MSKKKQDGYALPGMDLPEDNSKKIKAKKKNTEHLPEKLGKAIRLPVPDFSDPDRPLTCLEADFPIAQINALAGLEASSGAAKKSIYSMSKWWARRQSSVFRSLLIAAATEVPKDSTEAAKKVWDHYYCNHQKAGSFKKLKVLEPFMGGGTTLVEGSRLGMHMTGIDLNPVAWFVVKNELACSDPEQVKALFDHIEAEVKPQIQPFFTTICPRGHKGKWIDIATEQVVDIDPLKMSIKDRKRYRWDGPEVIYTFWAKHGHCQAKGCGHRTPIFSSPVVANKKLSTYIAECTCPNCSTQFDAELGETRIAPCSERVILDSEKAFTEISQPFANLLKDYDKGKAGDTIDRMSELKEKIKDETGLKCPLCGAFAGKKIETVLDNHKLARTASQRKKKDFKIKRKAVQMYLIIHPEWLKGSQGFEFGKELGGYAGASAEDTANWYKNRLTNLSLIEVRGKKLPDELSLNDGFIIDTTAGTVPKQANFTCSSCGKNQKRLEATKKTNHTAPLAIYALQCHCPQCELEGFNFKGRSFKNFDSNDIKRISQAEYEWETRRNEDLSLYWPQNEIKFSMRTHVKDPLPDHGYTHWWMLYNNRQLLTHASLLKTITEASESQWALDVKEQALGAFQQYLRSMSMFSFYHLRNDQLSAALSNSNFNPKNLVLETSVFTKIGSGRWEAYVKGVNQGLKWMEQPLEPVIGADIANVEMDDKIIPGSEPFCTSSTDLSMLGDEKFDLVITDPPFGNNLFYADLADFFYVWLRIPLKRWYKGLPEAKYFESERTPHSLEAIDNPAEHPDDREVFEKTIFIEAKHLSKIRELSGDATLEEKDLNPLFRPEPSSDFYSQTLSACWMEVGRLLKDGGIMAFTFHHSEDQAWIDILKALFDAGYVLVATYPIRSDESIGETAQFGSKKSNMTLFMYVANG